MMGRKTLLWGWKKMKFPELGKVASYEQLLNSQTDRWKDYILKWEKYQIYISEDK